MTRKKVVVSAKITIIWKITAYNLKIIKHKYLSNIDEYNYYAINVIKFFKEKEKQIKEINIKIDKLSYKKELENYINSLWG